MRIFALLFLVGLLAGCGGSDLCKEAIDTYYSTGCSLRDACGANVAKGKLYVACANLTDYMAAPHGSLEPESCNEQFSAWVECMEGGGCGCEAELQGLSGCANFVEFSPLFCQVTP